jgi:putative ABC transport system permease protein
MNYPFENDTERIEKRIAEKSVFSEKNRTFLIRVIILIAAFLLSFSGILLCNANIGVQGVQTR